MRRAVDLVVTTRSPAAEEDEAMTRTVSPRIGVRVVSLATLMLVVATSQAGAAAGDPLASMGGLRPAAPVVAPDPAFRTLDGRAVRLSELRGKVVLLGFFTTW
jgi:hypothetical protein